MAFKNKRKMPIPKEELAYVSPEIRMKLFDNMLNTYRNCIPDLKLILAYLHWNYNEEEKIQVSVMKKIGVPQPKIVFKKDDINDPTQNKEYSLQDNSKYANVRKKIKDIPVYDQPCYYDYLLIFRYKIQNINMIFIECPYISTNNSIPGYRYALRTKQLELWLNCVLDDMLRLPEIKFLEFITDMCGLSLDKNQPLYWKKEENLKFLVPKLLDLRLMYSNRNDSK